MDNTLRFSSLADPKQVQNSTVFAISPRFIELNHKKACKLLTKSADISTKQTWSLALRFSAFASAVAGLEKRNISGALQPDFFSIKDAIVWQLVQ